MKRKCISFAFAALFTFTGAFMLHGNDKGDKRFIKEITSALRKQKATISEYHESITRKVVYARNGLVSYVITHTGYGGGAHMYFSSSCGSIFFVTGKKLTLNDIATPAQRPVLLKLITKALRESRYDMTTEEFDRAIKPVLTENFYYSEKGLHVLYTPYEIASFVHGEFEVCINWPLQKFVLEFAKK